jgi:hypothetical protein
MNFMTMSRSEAIGSDSLFAQPCGLGDASKLSLRLGARMPSRRPCPPTGLILRVPAVIKRTRSCTVFARSYAEERIWRYARMFGRFQRSFAHYDRLSRMERVYFLRVTPCEHRVTPCPLDYFDASFTADPKAITARRSLQLLSSVALAVPRFLTRRQAEDHTGAQRRSAGSSFLGLKTLRCLFGVAGGERPMGAHRFHFFVCPPMVPSFFSASKPCFIGGQNPNSSPCRRRV